MFASTILFALLSSVYAGELVRIDTDTRHIGNRKYLGGGRRAQAADPCAGPLDTVNACIASFPGCGTCVNNAFDVVVAMDPLTCGDFESGLCDAINDECSGLCGTCLDELEDFYECVALDSGCTSFQCSGPVTQPAPTCTDGVLNGDETGIDCGGNCPPCQPTPPTGDSACGIIEFNQFCANTIPGSTAACVSSV